MCITDDCLNDNYQYNYCKNCFFIRRKKCIEDHKCFICDCKLRPFRTDSDWKKRILHKSCWLDWRPLMS